MSPSSGRYNFYRLVASQRRLSREKNPPCITLGACKIFKFKIVDRTDDGKNCGQEELVDREIALDAS